jgi:hypothetical protein
MPQPVQARCGVLECLALLMLAADVQAPGQSYIGCFDRAARNAILVGRRGESTRHGHEPWLGT